MNSQSVGSLWRRWDPHLHAPGTLLNDQFKSNWDGYFKAIEVATPAVEVLGVTDYFSIETYKSVVARRAAGQLPGVEMIFPNVEMRLEVTTAKKVGVNIHLLFSPDDADHVRQIERVLADLTFEYAGRKYRCTTDGLTDLGRAFNPAQRNDLAARGEGAMQFKVSLDQLRQMFRNDSWVAGNCLVAVAGSSTDGTAGVQADGSFTAWRKEVERFAHVIFGGTRGLRDYWAGRKEGFNPAFIEREYGGLKPCLHGSDAHSVDKVAVPDDERFCWIKGDATFETLRQAVLEPEERVMIGRAAPDRHNAGMCIAHVGTGKTAWLTNKSVPLNPGLVAIIGARGSGKTAIADIIATGAGVGSPRDLSSSFLYRATTPANLLRRAYVELTWGDGVKVPSYLCPEMVHENRDTGEQVRYLSQQFVEQLCSAEGLAVELRREIERVIFEATEPTDRLDADSFDQLADIHLDPIRTQRRTIQEAVDGVSERIVSEDALFQKLDALTKERDALAAKIEKTKADLLMLLPKGKELRAQRLAELEAAVATLGTAIDKQKRGLVRVGDLKAEAGRYMTASAPQYLEKLKTTYQEAGLTPTDWAAFVLKFSGDVRAVLAKREGEIQEVIRSMTEGDPATQPALDALPVTSWPYKRLVEERDRLKTEVGIDSEKQRRYSDLQKTLERDGRSLQRLTGEVEHAKGAGPRRQGHIEHRRELYAQAFQTYLDERAVLERLYGPLQTLLAKAEGALGRLRFSVARDVNTQGWANEGEDLLDLRKDSRLRGHGELLKAAQNGLEAQWKLGTAQEVSAAMQKFILDYYPDIRKSMPSGGSASDASEWMQRVATWLYGTKHITMRYSITYENVAIEHLSPGTRGIVLLMLYLVIDRHDQRPLIIDQPEENLDPKSVFEELVPHFREARKRRQVIIVTHNANLVVNTDADQVIVASSERQSGPGLPRVTYKSGSLENPDIRTDVCGILEGGERAFLDRERRYRLHRDPSQ